jgi:hypothetical protein
MNIAKQISAKLNINEYRRSQISINIGAAKYRAANIAKQISAKPNIGAAKYQ